MASDIDVTSSTALPYSFQERAQCAAVGIRNYAYGRSKQPEVQKVLNPMDTFLHLMAKIPAEILRVALVIAARPCRAFLVTSHMSVSLSHASQLPISS